MKITRKEVAKGIDSISDGWPPSFRGDAISAYKNLLKYKSKAHPILPYCLAASFSAFRNKKSQSSYKVVAEDIFSCCNLLRNVPSLYAISYSSDRQYEKHIDRVLECIELLGSHWATKKHNSNAMVASKILHFARPDLIPIIDNAAIKKKVLSSLRIQLRSWNDDEWGLKAIALQPGVWTSQAVCSLSDYNAYFRLCAYILHQSNWKKLQSSRTLVRSCLSEGQANFTRLDNIDAALVEYYLLSKQ